MRLNDVSLVHISYPMYTFACKLVIHYVTTNFPLSVAKSLQISSISTKRINRNAISVQTREKQEVCFYSKQLRKQTIGLRYCMEADHALRAFIKLIIVTYNFLRAAQVRLKVMTKLRLKRKSKSRDDKNGSTLGHRRSGLVVIRQ